MDMKLLYLTTKDFSGGMKDGVVKKVKNQIKCFEKYGYKVDYTYVDETDKTVHFVSDDDTVIGTYSVLGGVFNKIIISNYLDKLLLKESYIGSYTRFLGGRTDPWHLAILKKLKNKGIKNVLEFPTYPYDDEGSKFETYIDRCFRGYLKKYVDRVVTHYETDYIYEIKTILSKNAIFVDDYKVISSDSHEALNLIVVASFEVAHGYERLIESIAKYVREKHCREIIVHMVGDGLDRSLYESLVRKYELEKCFIFYGKKMGEELEAIYDKADIAVGCLGLYKKGLNTVSSLKSVEYVSKGLPVINGFSESLFANNKQFVCEFSNDDSLIDMEIVIKWYDGLIEQYGNKEKLIKNVRDYAKKTVDIMTVMKPIVDFINRE